MESGAASPRVGIDSLRACLAFASCCILVLTLGLATPAAAQVHRGVARIGILHIGAPAPNDRTDEGLVKGLRDLGYERDRNILLEYRYAYGRPERLDALAAELVGSRVDVLVAGGPGPLAAARKATATIPIVTVSGSDPVREGWAQSLARPGGNVTGLTVTFPELTLKRIELLKEALPQLTRVAVLMDPDEAEPALVTDGMQSQAKRLGLQLQVINVRRPEDFEEAFRSATEGRAQAVLAVETTFLVVNRPQIAAFAARERLPVVYEFAILGVDGMLMSYGADIGDQFRRAATYIDRILKGSHPGDLPVERPSKLQLTFNLKTARALGITIPSSVLLRADTVVE